MLRDRLKLILFALLLPIVHLGLGWFGFLKLRAWLASHPSKRLVFPTEENKVIEEAKHTAYLVSVAAKYGFVRATCLHQAMLLWWLLRNGGIQTELRIGVQHREGRVLAHAWVKRGDEVISEGSQVEKNFLAFDGLPEA